MKTAPNTPLPQPHSQPQAQPILQRATQAMKRHAMAAERNMMRAQWGSRLVDLAGMTLEPLLDPQEMPAKILAVSREHGDGKQAPATHIWLRPAQRWTWPQAGQFVSLGVTNSHGETVRRCYSLSGLDADSDRIRLSICEVADGEFSSRIAPTLQTGQLVTISAAAGDFVLNAKAGQQANPDAPLLLAAAGSGITPMLPLAEAALLHGRPVKLFSVQRGTKPLLAEEWQALQARFPTLLQIQHWNSLQQQRPSTTDLAAWLQQASANHAGAAELFICGADGFREALQQTALEQGIAASRIHVESFYQQAPAPVVSNDNNAAIVAQVSLSDGRAIDVRDGETILQAAQAAGVKLQHCCGQGVCRSCETRKVSGVVENIQTGLKQLRDGEWVLPCISRPIGHVELAI